MRIMYYTRTKALGALLMRLSVTLCLSSLLYTSVLFAVSPNGCEQQKCVVVIDAGSTGSRLHLYSYDLDATNSPVKITERYTKKIKPGFANIEPNAATVDAYLTTLFSGTPGQAYPVYFYATAGMRLLPQAKQQQLYSLVDSWFQSNANWQLAAAKTISGNDEGLYGWLALNYRLNKLANTDAKPAGYMDMGGASVEIAFPVTQDQVTDTKDIKNIDLYGQHFKVFVHSFLGLGQTEVTHQFLDTNSCFIKDYELPSGELAQGDAYQCESEVSALMNSVHHVNKAIQPILSLSSVKDWYVGGGLEELAKSAPFNFADNHFSSQELLEQGNSLVCQQAWPDFSAQYSNNDYLYGYCLFPAYYYALIVEGYGIQPGQALNYLPPEQNVDWSLGVVLEQKTS
ncbi:ectonucleoside triphosphate diphosphohydrolase I [Legionella busanensis]|uniref:Ectonucleoside triphosphate diphosphohydrolase I n=2 Tax=Legionella busanensis TaxID=190655 RepID=A0A378JID4_9GAMM|nr:ectonucleoside triphosphate diphosphohydrolase I [Legionella busanensis]